mmetsp:Transcript_32318/g.67607  ORF Transcript_32318/g.67607 Transcript_32318/m.67607 type:complete len:133 (+) Transcript_32318:58-456(+)
MKCCRWLFRSKYRDMEEDSKFAVTSPPPRPQMATTIGRSNADASEDISEAEREERRKMAAAKAQQRLDENMSRGVGDKEKVKQLQEKNQREEVLGRLEEQYARLGEELPMGVRLAELKKLKELQADAQASWT